jgi:hypothetical protein
MIIKFPPEQRAGVEVKFAWGISCEVSTFSAIIILAGELISPLSLARSTEAANLAGSEVQTD